MTLEQVQTEISELRRYIISLKKDILVCNSLSHLSEMGKDLVLSQKRLNSLLEEEHRLQLRESCRRIKAFH